MPSPSSPGRTGCACAAAEPRAACPPSQQGKPLLQLGLDPMTACASARRLPRSGWPGRHGLLRSLSVSPVSGSTWSADRPCRRTSRCAAPSLRRTGAPRWCRPVPGTCRAECHVVAVELQVDQAPQDAAHVVVDADAEVEQLAAVLLRVAHAVDANRGDDDVSRPSTSRQSPSDAAGRSRR